MNKGFLALAAASVLLLTGCSSVYTNNYGFAAVAPGALYSNQTHGCFILPKAENLDGVEVLRPVQGKATSTDIMLLFSFGDSGIEAAKKDALAYLPDADDIFNIEVDATHFSILSLFNTSTTTLRGLAVKYKTPRTSPFSAKK